MDEYLNTGRRIPIGGGVLVGGMVATVDEKINAEVVAKRVAKLTSIRRDLEAAVVAISALEVDAQEKQAERERLKQLLSQLQADTKSAEAILALPEDTFTRLFHRASSKGRLRGIAEGAIIGFVTGALSSLLVWYVTK
jgi:replicative DNA helicase